MQEEQVRIAAETELERFFQIAAQFGDLNQMFMPRCVVDEVWHGLLTQPSAYTDFCAQAGVPEFEHVKIGGKDEIPWQKQYEAKFGTLPKIWFTNSDGEFDAKAYKQYRQTGVWRASWDCTPKQSPATESAVHVN